MPAVANYGAGSYNHIDNRLGLYFFGNKIAFQAAGADLYRKGCSSKLSLYSNQVGSPGSAAVFIGVANLVASNGVFSANIASP